jgi:hypothetical protein
MSVFRRLGDKYNIDSQDVQESIKEELNPEKNRRFSWSDFLGNVQEVIPNPFNPFDTTTGRIRQQLEQKLIEEGKLHEQDADSWIDEVRKGINIGEARIAYSFADLLFGGLDLTFDTDTLSKVDEIFNNYKPEEPEGAIGDLTSLLVEYGVPGSLLFKITSRARKLLPPVRKLTNYLSKNKVTNIAQRAVGYAALGGATDYLAAGPDAVVPFREEKLIDTDGLEGRELAAARFKNRLLYGQEGAVLGGGFSLAGKPAALGFKYGLFKPAAKVAGVGLKTVDTLVISPASYLLSKDPIVIPTISKGLRAGGEGLLKKVLAPIAVRKLPFTKLPEFKNWRLFSVQSNDPLKARLKKLDNFLSNFRSLGKETGEQFALTSGARRYIKAQSRRIEKYLEILEKRAYNLAKSFNGQYDKGTTSAAQQTQYLDFVLEYLKGQRPLGSLPTELQKTAKNLNDELLKIKQNFGNALPEGDLRSFILDNVAGYMRKSFSIFTNSSYAPPPEIFDKATSWVAENVVRKNKDLVEAAIAGNKDLSTEEAIRSYAEILTQNILQQGKQNADDPLKTLQFISKDILRSDEILKTGEELPTVIKQLLGEEKNLKSSVLQTVTDMINTTTNKKLYDDLAKLGIKQGWLFKSREAARAAGILDAKRVGRVPGLGLLQSDLIDKPFYAAAEIAEGLAGSKGFLDRAMQNTLYNYVLQGKTLVQFGKTVLSPATQVRNVTSASFFPLANGHIGGNASVTNALKMVMDDIFGAGKVLDEKTLIDNITKKIELGVLDENIVASELQAVLKEIKAGTIDNTDTLINKLSNTKFMKDITRVYAGGDNLWKWYGHEYVKSQLKGVFKTTDEVAGWFRDIVGREYDTTGKSLPDAIEEAAAWYIRNTYPTYSKVPKVIQNLRKLPVGNFVSFPAEMIRTTYNILDLSLKEIASKNPKLRQLGYRRLFGATTVLGGAGTATSKISEQFTGVNSDMMDAYKRDYGASWEKTSNLIPISKPEDGRFKMINFSYFSPYDVINSPAESISNIFARRDITPKDARENLLYEFLTGPVKELISPFVSEAIFIEKLADVIPSGFGIGSRGGVTKTGAKVYSDSDSGGDKLTKSFFHLLEGLQPGATRTAYRIGQGFTGGKDYDPFVELTNLFTGVRVIEADIPKTLNYVLTDFNKIQKEVFETENFYTTDGWRDRGPSEMVNDFIAIQNEAFKEQLKIYRAIETARKFDVSDRELRKIMKDRKISSKRISNLLRGLFTPVDFSDGLFRKKLKELKKLEDKRDVEIFTNEKDRRYYFPKRELNNVIREYNRREFEVETPPAEKQASLSLVPTANAQVAEAEIKTPPLPDQPDPSVAATTKVASVTNPLSSLTNLSQAQLSLLSPSEQAIAQRLNRRV